jgi:hypothetical protein
MPVKVREKQVQQRSIARTWSVAAHISFARVVLDRNFLRACAVAAAWSSLATLVFFALSVVSLQTDNRVERAAVRDAFAKGVVRADNEAFLNGNTDIGAHQWNDCLVLHQVIDRRASPEQLAISPLDIGPSIKTTTPCADTAAIASGHPIAAQASTFYHRYLHGHTVLARLLLPMLSVADLRRLYLGLINVMLCLGIAQTIIGMTKGRRIEEGCVWLIMLFAFARFFGLESFGQSLAHGPADMVLAGFLLFLANGSSRGGLEPRNVPAAAAVFGVFTILFEFLTGGIPLGLALLVGGLPFAIRPLRSAEGETLPALLARAVAAFVVAMVMAIAIKTVLVCIVFGPDMLGETLQQLLFRMGLVDAPAFGGGQPMSPVALVGEVAANLDALTAGEPMMAWLILCIGAAAGVWGLRRLLQTGDVVARTRGIALASSNLAVVGWLILFMQHSTQHARFMDRILVWIIASGMALFALAVIKEVRLPKDILEID